MGADIHLTVERRTSEGWERLDDDFWGRSYLLFAMLAGVRNNGWVDPLTPISEPRGLPGDVHEETLADSEDWGVDGHSHSWLGLDELLAVDWSQQLTRRCWVRRIPALPPSRLNETPDEFASSVQEAARALGGLPPAEYWGYQTCQWSSAGQGPSGWRTIEWAEPWYSAASPEWWGLVMRMVRAAGDDLSAVRIVFWFDN